jgi:hypothetical protein
MKTLAYKTTALVIIAVTLTPIAALLVLLIDMLDQDTGVL